MKRLRSVVVLLVLAGLALGSDIIRQGTLNAYSNGANIIVQWGTTDESQVAHFYVQRSTSSNDGFQDISSAITPKGSYSTYEFTDYSAFKTTASIYFYKIRIEGKDGSSSFSDVKSVTHSVSSVRRTWGSLKAMFR